MLVALFGECGHCGCHFVHIGKDRPSNTSSKILPPYSQQPCQTMGSSMGRGAPLPPPPYFPLPELLHFLSPPSCPAAPFWTILFSSRFPCVFYVTDSPVQLLAHISSGVGGNPGRVGHKTYSVWFSKNLEACVLTAAKKAAWRSQEQGGGGWEDGCSNTYQRCSPGNGVAPSQEEKCACYIFAAYEFFSDLLNEPFNAIGGGDEEHFLAHLPLRSCTW